MDPKGITLHDAHVRQRHDTEHDRSAYGDGMHAAYRTGMYTDSRYCPVNPFPADTPDHEDWERGFGDATDNLWDPVIQGWGEYE